VSYLCFILSIYLQQPSLNAKKINLPKNKINKRINAKANTQQLLFTQKENKSNTTEIERLVKNLEIGRSPRELGLKISNTTQLI
jgi:hypothetical protein